MNHLKEVREAVIKAVPEAFGVLFENGKVMAVDENAPIQLADVLRAIEDKGLVRGLLGKQLSVDIRNFKDIEQAKAYAYQNPEDWIHEVRLSGWMSELIIIWNLALPLDEQPEEVIEFLYNILLASLKQTV